MDILLGFLLGAVAIAVLMHLHFRNSPDLREAVASPGVFAVGGALIAISLGMMRLWADSTGAWEGRIHLEKGIMHVFAGAAAGGVVGIGARAIFVVLPRTRAVGFVLTVALLAASAGAPVGWLYGDILRHRKADDTATEAVRSTQHGMAWASAIGGAIGLALGLLELRSGGRRTDGAVAPPGPENVAS